MGFELRARFALACIAKMSTDEYRVDTDAVADDDEAVELLEVQRKDNSPRRS